MKYELKVRNFWTDVIFIQNFCEMDGFADKLIPKRFKVCLHHPSAASTISYWPPVLLRKRCLYLLTVIGNDLGLIEFENNWYRYLPILPALYGLVPLPCLLLILYRVLFNILKAFPEARLLRNFLWQIFANLSSNTVPNLILCKYAKDEHLAKVLPNCL